MLGSSHGSRTAKTYYSLRTARKTPLQENFDGDALGDVCDDDDDNDGLLDSVETNTGVFVSPGNTGSNPMNPDSDGDGFDDGVEVSLGSDPNNPGSVPVRLQGTIQHQGLDCVGFSHAAPAPGTRRKNSRNLSQLPIDRLCTTV